MPNNILISGDYDGTVKTWDVNEGQFRLLNAIKVKNLLNIYETVIFDIMFESKASTIEWFYLFDYNGSLSRQRKRCH